MRKSFVSVVALALALPPTFGAQAALSSTYAEVAELHAPSSLGRQMFGFAVAISGAYIAVGAPGDDDTGHVFVFSQTGGRYETAVLHGSEAGDESFGVAVAASGGTVVVGEPGLGAGEAYVFGLTNGSWHQLAKLEDPHPVTDAGFGLSVAIFGQTLLVGAPNARQIYVYSNGGKGWRLLEELKGQGGADGPAFGSSVAIAGRTAVVGVPGYGLVRGAAYLYNVSSKGLGNRVTLEGVNPPPRYRPSLGTFGSAVAVAGTTVVVGAPPDSIADGGAFVFEKKGSHWDQVSALEDFDGYGHIGPEPLAVSANTILVGSRTAAYVFPRTGNSWSEQAPLRPSPSANIDLGFAVAVSGPTAVVGASNDPSGNRIYVFRRI